MLELLKSADPRLRQETKPYVFHDHSDVQAQQIVDALTEVMRSSGGVGLSANQIGMKWRVFIIKVGDEIVPIFNPKLVDTFGENVYYDEGCLSFPNLFMKVKRFQGLRLRFASQNGEVDTKKFTGMTARIMLHEIDHLDGVVFTDRANRMQRERGMKKKKQLDRRAKAA